MAAHRGHWTGGLSGTGVDDGVCGWGGWKQRRKGFDCTGYITRHSWLSPMRFNARSRTCIADTRKSVVPRILSFFLCFRHVIPRMSLSCYLYRFSIFVPFTIHISLIESRATIICLTLRACLQSDNCDRMKRHPRVW